MNSCADLHLVDLYLLDGTGEPPRRSEILLSNGRIAAIGAEKIGGGAGVKISCGGKFVSPGFIDAHGHSDISALAHPELEARLSQGVTTEIAGNCGLSPFPLTAANHEHLEQLYRRYQTPLVWDDFTSYRARLAAASPAVDVIPLVGHNTLRAAVLGYENTPCRSEQLAEQQKLLTQMLTQGAPGLSLGLLYVPGKFAAADELRTLFAAVQGAGKVVTCHLASEGKHLLECLTELGELALSSGLKRLHISHFKTAGRDNFGKLQAALASLAELRSAGLEITFDRYPYTRSMTQLSLVLPDAWSDIDDASITSKLRDDETCRRTAAELRRLRPETYWEQVLLVDTPHPAYRKSRGRPLSELAPDPVTAVLEILRCDSCASTAAFSGMSADNLRTILLQDCCMGGSDGTALPADGSLGIDHPRSYGALARHLRLLLDWNVLPGEAVRRLTGLPADVFKLADRGRIAAGCRADLTVFDPDTIDGPADFTDPCRRATGIRQVICAGRITSF